MTTPDLKTLSEEQLLQEARNRQHRQLILITGRNNPQMFGQLERELEAIWVAVDALRATKGGH